MPTLRAFEVAIAIAEERSLSAAARRLHLSQPAVSHQVAVLEGELGVELFERGKRGAVPTLAGRAVVSHAREAVRAAARAVDAARSDGGEPVRIAAAESFLIPFVAPAVARWISSGRPVPVLLEASSRDAAVSAVIDGAADIALVPGPVDEARMSVVPVASEEIVVTADDGHPLLERAVPWGELADEPLVGVSADNGFASWVSSAFAREGVAENAVLRVRTLSTAAALARAGLGIAVVPVSAVASGAPRASLSPAMSRPLVVVMRRGEEERLAEIAGVLRRAVVVAVA